MRTFAYERILRAYYGERTFFDKFRKDAVHFLYAGVTVGMVAFHVDDGGSVRRQRKQMPAEFARFRKKNTARQRSVLFAHHGEIAHAGGLAAYVGNERYAQPRKYVCGHRGDRGLAVRPGDSGDGAEILRDRGQELVPLYDSLLHGKRRRDLFVRQRHRG